MDLPAFGRPAMTVTTPSQNAPAVKAGEQVFQRRFSGGKARFQHRLIHLWYVVVG